MAIRHRLLLAVLGIVSVGMFLADVYTTPDALIPAAAYAVPIVIAAWALPPRQVAAISIWTALLEVGAALVHPTPPTPWLFAVYIAGIAFFGTLGTALSSRIERETLRAADLERTAAENARLYQESKFERARWQATVESMLDPVTVADAEGRATYMNSAYTRMVGMTIQDGLALQEHSTHYKLYRPDGGLFDPNDLPLQKAALRNEEVRDVEIVEGTSWGEKRITVWNASPLHDDAGRVMGAVAVGRDVTQQRQAEAERERLVKTLEEQAEQLHLQNEELQSQTEELEIQSEELASQNHELLIQRVELARLADERTAIIESIADAVIVCDERGVITLGNAAARDLLGVIDVASNRGLADYLVALRLSFPDGRPVPVNDLAISRALRGERTVGSEESGVHPRTGQGLSLLVSAGPLRDQSGRIVGAVEVATDVTRIRQAEQALRESEEKFRSLYTSMSEGVVLHEVIRGEDGRASDYRILDVNPAFEAITGLDRDAAVGGLASHVYGTGQAPYLDIYARVAATGEPESFETSFEPMGKAFAISVFSPARGRFATVFQDVTDRKRSEAERERLLGILDESNRQLMEANKHCAEIAEMAERHAAELQSVLDNMTDAVFVADTRGRITMANRAAFAVVGMDESEVTTTDVGHLADRLMARNPDGQPRPKDQSVLARALAGETVSLADSVFRNQKTGRDVHLRSNAVPMRDTQGRVIGAVAVARDVTDLMELEHLKDQLITVAAHELKTPVTIMKGYAQLLQRKGHDLSPERRKILESINRGADRIDSVVQGLLDISLLTTGAFRLALERIDLAEFVEQAADRAAVASPTHHVRLARADRVSVQADRLRLGQVLDNLLDNAVRYSPSGGAVDLEVLAQRDRAVVAVRDRGIGIPARKQARIFERLYRAHTGTPHDHGGMGVGLYLSREIVRRHGGEMEFESVEGVGSTFRFSLPLEVSDGGE